MTLNSIFSRRRLVQGNRLLAREAVDHFHHWACTANDPLWLVRVYAFDTRLDLPHPSDRLVTSPDMTPPIKGVDFFLREYLVHAIPRGLSPVTE